MIDLRGQTGFTADSDQFLDCFNESISLAAHVRNVFPLIARSHFAKLNQFFG
jgi:hypothetical protein